MSLISLCCRRCGTEVLLTDSDFAALPRRTTNGDIIVDASTAQIRLLTKRDTFVTAVAKARDTIERQLQHKCPKCDLFVLYEGKIQDDIKLLYLRQNCLVLPVDTGLTKYPCRKCERACHDPKHREIHESGHNTS